MLSRMLPMVALSICAAGTGIAVASAVNGGQAAPTAPVLDPTPIPGSERLEGASDDPHDGPRWRVYSYRSVDGRRCHFAGQSDGARIGFADHGSLQPVDPPAAAACGWREGLSSEVPIAAHVSTRAVREGEGVVVVWGDSHPSVRAVRVASPLGQRTMTPGSRRGGFVAAFRGTREDLIGSRITLTAVLDDGSAVREAFDIERPPARPGDGHDHQH